MIKTQPHVYLAGPITGLTFQEAKFGWREDVAQNLFQKGVGVISPMRFKDVEHFSEDHQKSLSPLGSDLEIMSTEHGLTVRDYNDVVRCDLVFANLLGSKIVTIGTVMEIAWAFMLRKPCVIVMDKDNIHQHAMIRASTPYRVEKLSEGVRVTLGILGVGL